MPLGPMAHARFAKLVRDPSDGETAIRAYPGEVTLLAIGCALGAPLYAAAQPATAPISGSTMGQVQSPGVPPSADFVVGTTYELELS